LKIEQYADVPICLCADVLINSKYFICEPIEEGGNLLKKSEKKSANLVRAILFIELEG